MTSRLSVTVDDEVKDEIETRPNLNVSGLVNELLSEYLFGQDQTTEATVLEHEAEKLKDELDDLAETRSEKQERLEELQQKKQELEEQGRPDDLVRSFEIILDNYRRNPGSVTADNPAVQNQAGENGMTAEQFLDEFDSWRAEDTRESTTSSELKSVS